MDSTIISARLGVSKNRRKRSKGEMHQNLSLTQILSKVKQQKHHVTSAAAWKTNFVS